ncbi:hypothetical protein [Nonomuraea longicatena]|uniref:Lipopolysaccharide biosynthesis protein n=1 Tax=Nonomuraea longicatena TaxID=83682 RepID=A0ABP3ZQ88_9ACTN
MKYVRQMAASALRGWPLVAAALLGGSAGLVFSLVKVPVYTAEAYVVVVSDERSNIDQATNFAQAFAKIVTQPTIIAAAVRPGLPARTVDELQQSIRVSSSPEAPLIRLSASAPNAGHAATQANAVAQALISYANRHAVDTGVRIAGLSTASAPVQPSSPGTAVSVTVGVAGGCLIGALSWLVRPARRPRRDGGEPPAREYAARRQKAKQRVEV